MLLVVLWTGRVLLDELADRGEPVPPVLPLQTAPVATIDPEPVSPKLDSLEVVVGLRVGVLGHF
jgi:hypothetical protein